MKHIYQYVIEYSNDKAVKNKRYIKTTALYNKTNKN